MRPDTTARPAPAARFQHGRSPPGFPAACKSRDTAGPEPPASPKRPGNHPSGRFAAERASPSSSPATPDPQRSPLHTPAAPACRRCPPDESKTCPSSRFFMREQRRIRVPQMQPSGGARGETGDFGHMRTLSHLRWHDNFSKQHGRHQPLSNLPRPRPAQWLNMQVGPDHAVSETGG
jgi:hypothetical protein